MVITAEPITTNSGDGTNYNFLGTISDVKSLEIITSVSTTTPIITST